MTPPTPDDLVAIGRSILGSFPAPFDALLGRVPIRVQDWADGETLAELGIDDPLDLTGLFHGRALGETADLPAAPDMVFLYRLPILLEWCERGVALEEVVFDVLTHEVGHYFGLSEDAALRLEGR